MTADSDDVALDPDEPGIAPWERASRIAVAATLREIAVFDAQDGAATNAARFAAQNRGRSGRASVVFSFRLDPAELDALEQRAAIRGMKPSVLARNLVRMGLCAGDDDGDRVALAQAVGRLDDVIAELRTLTK